MIRGEKGQAAKPLNNFSNDSRHGGNQLIQAQVCQS
jgi:hypothetical protein